MNADLKPYAEYKDSGLPWLGQVPQDWKTQRAKYCFREVDERSKTGREVLCSVSHKTGVTPRKSNVTMFMAESTIGYKICQPEDLVINTLWAWMAALGIARQVGIVSPAYGVYRPFSDSRLNPSYADKLLRTPQYMSEYMARSTGVNASRLRLYPEQFLAIPLLLPPPNEQSAIVRFLDWANGRLERAIRAKRKVIALLNEQKQAIIHRAVTRGLDPSVPLKPSGIPWLGDIPKHWSQRPLWSLSRLRTERNPGNLPLLSVFLDRGVIRYEDGGGQVHAPSLDLSNYQVVRKGDFVLNNQQAWRGSVGVSRFEGIISPAYIVLTLSNLLETRFANYLMRSRAIVDQFVAASRGVGDIQRQIFWPFLRMVQIPFPTFADQSAIAEYIDCESVGLMQTISRLEREIDLLREYRIRLVADVVTGKLDVRDAAKKVPDDEPLPDAAVVEGNDPDDDFIADDEVEA
jgi:type I restriction enzyme S subunit